MSRGPAIPLEIQNQVQKLKVIYFSSKANQ